MAKLPGEAIEVINRNALVSLALTRGYIAFLPVYDGGVDFMALLQFRLSGTEGFRTPRAEASTT
jgi:hypothetical protein